MSKAYKCDRCGKLYEAKERTLEFKEHAVLKPHTINYEVANPGTYLFYVADLCPECQKQLEMWMKGTVFEILEEIKGCHNCKYYHSLINTEPCFSCSHIGTYSFWEPEEDQSINKEESMGSLKNDIRAMSEYFTHDTYCCGIREIKNEMDNWYKRGKK